MSRSAAQMWPPLIRLLWEEPGLVAEHAAAYVDLIKEDASWWQTRIKRRAVYVLVLVAGGLLGVLFGGVALMLYGATESGHWLLWAVPAAPLAAAAIAAALLARDAPAPPFRRVRAQLHEDMPLFSWKEPES